jgi:nicotinate phosphoribosyltransferase
VAKLSTGKATLPGQKQVWRSPDGDVVALLGEEGPTGGEPLLEEAMRGGRITRSGGWEAARDRFAAEMERLPKDLRSLEASPQQVQRSAGLERLTEEVRAGIRERELG